jgi:protein-L-isoaspartate(D-aspartate) O-methyltransferase
MSTRFFPARPRGWLLLAWCVLIFARIGAADDYASQRRALVEEIRRETRWLGGDIGQSELDPKVLDALNRVPRHEFVPATEQAHAYANRPLPIGYGQTISQPLIVALMTDLLRVDGDDRVLEIGTGSGYQAAVLAELVDRVFSIEIVPELARSAGERLKRLGYGKVEVKVGDGHFGWPEQSPFDAIIVTAAPTQIPPPLVRQLKPGGRMVIPVGAQFLPQYLVLVEKGQGGEITTRQILPVQFVPLTGGPKP